MAVDSEYKFKRGQRLWHTAADGQVCEAKYVKMVSKTERPNYIVVKFDDDKIGQRVVWRFDLHLEDPRDTRLA